MPKSLPVIVETDELNGTDVKIKTIDYNNPNHRRWLAKHSLWALNHGKEIRTRPASIELTD